MMLMPASEQSLGFLLNDVARLLRRDFNRKAVGLGLSLAQWRALAYLSRREGINQVTLAEGLEVQPMTLARLVDRLESAGLLERRPDPRDRRAFNLYLTKAAQPLIEKMRELASEAREDALSGLSQEGRQALLEGLAHMKRNLSLLDLTEGDSGGPQEKAATGGTGSY